MTDAANAPMRLAKRVVEQLRCSRREAEWVIEGGWVRVDDEIVEQPQFMVQAQSVTIDPHAELRPSESATILLNMPASAGSGTEPVNPWPISAAALVTPTSRWADDASGWRTLKRHFARLRSAMPLEPGASGLLVLTQDGRVERRLSEDAAYIEQEYIVEVSGTMIDGGLQRLNRGMPAQGGAELACKVSWQNETRLRFAIKPVRPGQIRGMCAEVGLVVVASKRIRIGRIPLGRMPPGEWRYLPTSERF